MPKTPSKPRCSESYDKVAAPIANRPAGSITETLSRVPNNAGESPLGDIIADAQLAATSAAASGGAVIAFTNPGGIRIDIARKDEGAVTYADLFASQPFRNQLVTLTLTGKQIKDMLEQQWLDPKRPRILQVSKGFAYAWDNSKPNGERILPERMSLNGAPIDPAANYRVTVNNFLSVGGDGFTVLKDATAPANRRLRHRRAACLFPGQQPDRSRRRQSHYAGLIKIKCAMALSERPLNA